MKRGIRAVLESRFGDEGLRLMGEIEALRDGHLLETILEQANRVSSPEPTSGLLETAVRKPSACHLKRGPNKARAAMQCSREMLVEGQIPAGILQPTN